MLRVTAQWGPPSWRCISMKRLGCWVWVGMMMVAGMVLAQNRTLDSPQSQMISARMQSLGGANPVLLDVGTMMINPAVLGRIDYTPISFSNQSFLGNAIHYTVFNMAIPFEFKFSINSTDTPQRVTFGLSYGGAGMGDIPETIYSNNRIFQTGLYSAGFNLLHASAGTQFFGLFGSNVFSAGVATKLLQQYIKSDSRIGFGLDAGIIADYSVSGFGIEALSVGVSFLNVLGTTMVWPGNVAPSTLPIQLLFGASISMWDGDLLGFIVSGARGLTLGSEYWLQESVSVRGSVGGNELNLGIGLQFDNVVGGIFDDDYAVRFDYNYNQLLGGDDALSSNIFSLTVLGSSRPSKPRILSPSNVSLTQETMVALSGVGPPKTSIQIYTNGGLSRTTQTDRFGNWSYPTLPVTEGDNRIYIMAYDIAKENSVKSDVILVTSDTSPPKVTIGIVPVDQNELEVTVSSNEILSQLQGGVDGVPIGFQSTDGLFFKGRLPYPSDLIMPYGVPTQFKFLQLVYTDRVGNQGAVDEYPFFAKVQFPTDMSIHYFDSIRILGMGSPAVKMVYVNGDLAKMDSINNFSLVRGLKLGKNLLTLIFKTDGMDIEHSLRVLRLKSYSDISKAKERREIEFMATLGIIEGEKDGRFYPDREVTRRYMARLLATQAKVKPTKRKSDLFSDVKQNDVDSDAIEYVIENGYLYAFPDGTFRPDRTLTSSEVLSLLASAGIIDDQVDDSQEETMTRKQLARLLAINPRFDSQIETLVNWEEGYE